jgi:coproporphyrinogen III oxidase-like Fe-S oxidoreductase
MLREIAASLAGFFTQQEGRKFLQLYENIDEQAFSSIKRENLMSLYIHIPFCRTLCPFCCFNKFFFIEDKARLYFRNLKKELKFYIKKGFTFSRFYFGGGTPTILMDELIGFIDFLKENFDVKQISLETTTSEINSENIELLKTAGINRLSIGIQSFNNDILKSMGRFETGKEAKEKLEMAQGHFDTVNADFIFNLPNQTIDNFVMDVKAFKSMIIDQATFYPLMPSPKNIIAIKRKIKWIYTSREKKFYDVILRELYEEGYKPSTAWCFSRGDRMIDEYIIDYDDYIGIGAGAISFLKGNFFLNSFSLERYAHIISNEKLPIIFWKRLTEKEHLRYYLLTKLFGMSIDPQKFSRKFGDDIHRKLKLELLFFKVFGLVNDDKNITLTRKGMYSISVMMKEFFEALNSLREYCIANRI